MASRTFPALGALRFPVVSVFSPRFPAVGHNLRMSVGAERELSERYGQRRGMFGARCSGGGQPKRITKSARIRSLKSFRLPEEQGSDAQARRPPGGAPPSPPLGKCIQRWSGCLTSCLTDYCKSTHACKGMPVSSEETPCKPGWLIATGFI
ncbi:hypothetical protein EYF80_037424 [Liparis tanakae]|uniref:Uncharacterized protein n=1 Tax=Liparis tanakae TaxID=230148 RepID=A0A4Z2GGJ0_9TELE|nr:hypothetical protein EYF80_037424 [Liparis tanakae]